MIKLLSCQYHDNNLIFLEFSDGVSGFFNLDEYLSCRHGPMLEPLQDAAFARRCFIDAGALCWPHGLEISPARLHESHLLKQVA